jgi:hypothetical protein
MYIWHFCNDFVINSAQLNVYEDIMYGFLAIGWNHDLILHLVPHSTLHLSLDPECDPTFDLANNPALEAH